TGLPTGPATGAAARAALGVRRKPLLCVVLLIGGRVDELHPAVDAGQLTISVGHETFLSSWRGSSPGRRTRAATTADRKALRDGSEGRRRWVQVPLWSPCVGRTGDWPNDHTPRCRIEPCTESALRRTSGTGVEGRAAAVI